MDQLTTITQLYHCLLEVFQEEGKPSEQLEKLDIFFQTEAFNPHILMNHLGKIIQPLDWLLNDVLLPNLETEIRFKQQLSDAVQSILMTRSQSFISTHQPPLPEQKNDLSPNNVPHKEILLPNQWKQQSNPYDPFTPEIMDRLKTFCRQSLSTQALGLLDLLQHPHALFVFLDHLEAEYETEHPFGESIYLDDVIQSESHKDFLIHFFRMKFLAHGYFNVHGTALPFDKETKEFEKNGEVYLRFTRNVLETPMGLLRRILRILLGYEDPDMIGKKSMHPRSN